MFKYLLIKTILDVSDNDVVERSKYAMSFKYFLDIAPESSVIDPSSLTKFRKLRLQYVNLLNMFWWFSYELVNLFKLTKHFFVTFDNAG